MPLGWWYPLSRATKPEIRIEIAVQNPDASNARQPPVPTADAEGVFAQLFDLSPFPAVVSRLHDHTVLAINLRTSELFGIPQKEAVGLLVTDYYVDPADRLRLADQIRREGRADNLRLQVRGRNDKPFWALASSRFVTWHGEPAILTAFRILANSSQPRRR
jgi:PAS domain-containing protein